MNNRLSGFERIVRNAFQFTSEDLESRKPAHPFDTRNIHPMLPLRVRELFDDGHYAEATFEAFKYIDVEVARLAGDKTDSGFKLMMKVFPETNPILALTPCSSTTEKDEQKGFQFLFAGSITAIRNPRGHKHSVVDALDQCLDHLALASLLLRRLEQAGYVLQ